MYFKKLWTEITIENYNDSKPLTGPLDALPSKYEKLFKNIPDFFETIALRAQNDINTYLGFIFNKFTFETFPSEIKETVINMIFILIEHWIFNRVPIEFFVDATNTINTNNMNYVASSSASDLNDLIPQRVKALAKASGLKEFIHSLSDDNELNPEMIDLEHYYTKWQMDQIKEMIIKKVDTKLDQTKQLKLFNHVHKEENVMFSKPKNILGQYEGKVTNIVARGNVAVEYDPDSETLILDFLKQISKITGSIVQKPETIEENGNLHAISSLWAYNFVNNFNFWKQQNNLLLEILKQQEFTKIGQISWFYEKPTNNWLILNDKIRKFKIKWFDKEKIITVPALRNGDFIRHNISNVGIQQEDTFKEHLHQTSMAKYISFGLCQNSYNSRQRQDFHYIDLENSNSAYMDVEGFEIRNTADDWKVGVGLAVKPFYRPSNSSSGVLTSAQNLTFGSYDSSTIKTKLSGSTETRPKNVALIAAIYLGDKYEEIK